jgi:FliI/YscN family ATPase
MDQLHSVRPGDLVVPLGDGFRVPVGPAMLGRVVDGLGRPIDGKGPIKGGLRAVTGTPPAAFDRPRVTEMMPTGVKAIDAAIPCGKGQRVGIFAGSGVGKSTLMGMIARSCLSQVNVIALVGERGKEVMDFVEESLGAEGLARSILVVATSDRTPLHRVRAADTAMAIAEYFRDQGADVIFMIDSVTRYAMAQREIGLSAGEPPATRGYPPSVFALLPRLLERAGRSQKGSITAFATVLVEGDDMNDPIADSVRSILDGHIVLSRRIAAGGRYPAVDVLESVSRVAKDVSSPDHLKLGRNLRKLMASYREAEDMINIGAYVPGSNSDIDRALKRHKPIQAFLTQDSSDKCPFQRTLEELKKVADE